MSDVDPRILHATDGFPLAATVFGESRSKRRLIVAPATGVPQRFYRHFAAFMTESGWPALTFDYRGIGGSRPAGGGLRGFEASMLDWAEKDLAGAVAHAKSALAAEQVVVVGHSFGGQAVGLLPNAESIDALVGVGAQLGDFRLWPAPDRYLMAAVMYGAVPLATSAIGYLPGKLGIGEDLPSGVARQWARWCTRPGYFLSGKRAPRRERFEHLNARVRLYSFDDDRYAPARAVDALGELMTAAVVERRHVHPLDVGAERIGHFGFFRPTLSDSLWSAVASFFDAAAASPALLPRNRESARDLDAYLYRREERIALSDI